MVTGVAATFEPDPPPARTPRRPRRLRPGDRVAVVCPSSPADPARLRAGCRMLREHLDLDVVLGAHALTELPPGHLAGADADRARDLEDAWLDPDVAAVFCARGGYGAARVLDLLRWDRMAEVEPKILLGGSDATALHQAFAAHLDVVTLFGPMPATAAFGAADGPPDPRTLEHLRTTLFTPEDATVFTAVPDPAGGSGPAARSVVRGVTAGGTLSLLAGSVGCAESRPAAGAVVVLEDIGEAPYRIDRMLTQLLRADWFAGVAGVAAGSWLDCGPAETVHGVLRERLTPLGIPVVTGFDIGHGLPQLTLPLGVEAELDPAAGTLTLTAAALR